MPNAKDVMSTEVVALDADATVRDAIGRMIQHRVSSLPVLDGSGRLRGMLSESDLLDLVWDPASGDSPVFRYMTGKVCTVAEEDDLATLVETFRMLGGSQIPVMRAGRLVGVVHRRDVLRHLAQQPGRSSGVVVVNPADWAGETSGRSNVVL